MKDYSALLVASVVIVIALFIWYIVWIMGNDDLTLFQKLLLLRGR